MSGAVEERWLREAAALLDGPPSVERLLQVAAALQCYDLVLERAAEDAWWLAREELRERRLAAAGGESLA